MNTFSSEPGLRGYMTRQKFTIISMKKTKHTMRASTIILTVLSLLVLTIAWGQPNGKFEPIDIFDIEMVSDPRISPDGKTIVYVRNFKDIMSDGNRSNLWIIDTDGKNHKPLTSGNVNNYAPRWSPDGTKLAYVSSSEGKPQIFMRWMEDGTTAKITNLLSSPSAVKWSPDGKWLALTMDVKQDQSSFSVMPAKPEGANWADPPIYIDHIQYRGDGQGYLDQEYSQIFLLSAEGGTPRQVTHKPYHHYGIDWAPDSKALVFVSNNRPNWEFDPRNSEIHELNLDDLSIKTLTSRYGPDGSPKISPDGRNIAYLGFDDAHQGYQIDRLYIMNRDGSNPYQLCADLDRDIEDISWSKDGGHIYFQYDNHGNTNIARTDMKGSVTRLADNVGGLSLGRPYSGGAHSVSSNGRVAFTYGTTQRPADLAIYRDGNVHVLTGVNEDLFAHKQLGEVEEIWYNSSYDGRQIQGWIVKPPGFDASKKYPLMLEIHGGPFTNYGARFSAEIQLFAAKGYVVLYTNPRGSTSYGEEFGNLIHHNYPGNDYDDLMSGVDEVIAKGYIDEDQLYVTGGSGGGVLTSWIIGKTNRFRAAVVAKPVINWYSFVLYSDNLGFFHKYWFPGKPWEQTEHYMSRSPINLVGNVSTPTMLLTGEEDWRTPISESEQYYAALKLQGVDCAMVRIPGASHGIASKPSQLIAKVNSIVSWFDKHKKENSKP